MKKIATLAAALYMILFAFPVMASSEIEVQSKGSAGWEKGSPYNKLYNVKTVETLSGEVVRVDKITPNKGMSYGIHLIFKTDKETLSVHLGPGWYWEKQDLKIEPKNRLVIKGSRVSFGGRPAIIAAEVKKGDLVLKLRDDQGFPVWSGWRNP